MKQNNYTLILDPNFTISIYEGGNSIFLGKKVYERRFFEGDTLSDNMKESLGAYELLSCPSQGIYVETDTRLPQ